ncbi:MAG: hypothetical protein V1661_01555 [bacterium]
MKVYKLSIIITFLALLFVPAVYAAENAVIFYPATKILSVAGQCEKKEVLILIYYAGTDKIWGSGSVKCQDGQYQHQQNFNDWKISDGEFEVEIYDGGYKAKKESPAAGRAREKVVVEGMNLKNSAASAPVASEDESAMDSGIAVSDAEMGDVEGAAAPESGDNFSLNGILGFFFGVVQNVGDAIQNFAVVIAKTIKTTTLAAIKIFAKDLAIVPNGKIIVPAGENQMSGRAIILSGTTQVKINNSKINEQSKIFLTALSQINFPLAIIEKNNGQGFTAGISQPAEKDIAFDWLIVDSYDARIDAGSVPSPLPNSSPPYAPPAPIADAPAADSPTPAPEIVPSDSAPAAAAGENASSTAPAQNPSEEPPAGNSASSSTTN